MSASATSAHEARPAAQGLGFTRRELGGLLVSLLLAAPILIYFHDRSWIPADDGQYAHIADRILQGEILHRDVYDLHGDYVHWIHAAAMKLFGRDLVSLRYPLIALGLLQAAVMFWACARRGIGLAILASFCVTAIGFPQISSPTPNLYAMFGCVAAVAVLSRFDRDHTARVLLLGFIVGLTFWFRQLTGVLLGMGVVTVLFAEQPSRLGRSIHIITLAGLTGYLATSVNAVGIVLFGIGPVAILIWAIAQPTKSSSRPRALVQLLIGAMVASLPLLLFHGFNGTLPNLFEGCFVRVLEATRLPYLEWGNYADYLFFGGLGAALGEKLRVRINGLYWIILPLLSISVAGIALRSVLRRMPLSETSVPIVACFYALVAVFNQIPYYLYLTIGLSLVAMLWSASAPRPRFAVAALSVALCAIALGHHGGQTYRRSLVEVFRGDTRPLQEARIPGARLRIDRQEGALYREVIATIRSRTAEGTAILVVPNNADLYFLSGRRNPSANWNLAFGFGSGTTPPGLIVHNEADKSNTPEVYQSLAKLGLPRVADRRVEMFAFYPTGSLDP